MVNLIQFVGPSKVNYLSIRPIKLHWIIVYKVFDLGTRVAKCSLHERSECRGLYK